jgi:hypothetical protein
LKEKMMYLRAAAGRIIAVEVSDKNIFLDVAHAGTNTLFISSSYKVVDNPSAKKGDEEFKYVTDSLLNTGEYMMVATDPTTNSYALEISDENLTVRFPLAATKFDPERYGDGRMFGIPGQVGRPVY